LWLEVDRNEDTGIAVLIRQSDPLLCEHREEIVGVEAFSIHLEGQAPECGWRPIGTVCEVTAARELPVRRDDLLHEDGDLARGRLTEHSL
jgi:hypothetical protein